MFKSTPHLRLWVVVAVASRALPRRGVYLSVSRRVVCTPRCAADHLHGAARCILAALEPRGAIGCMQLMASNAQATRKHRAFDRSETNCLLVPGYPARTVPFLHSRTRKRRRRRRSRRKMPVRNETSMPRPDGPTARRAGARICHRRSRFTSARARVRRL